MNLRSLGDDRRRSIHSAIHSAINSAIYLRSLGDDRRRSIHSAINSAINSAIYLRSLGNNRRLHPHPLTNQVVVHSADGDEGWDEGVRVGDAARGEVREDEHLIRINNNNNNYYYYGYTRIYAHMQSPVSRHARHPPPFHTATSQLSRGPQGRRRLDIASIVCGPSSPCAPIDITNISSAGEWAYRPTFHWVMGASQGAVAAGVVYH